MPTAVGMVECSSIAIGLRVEDEPALAGQLDGELADVGRGTQVALGRQRAGEVHIAHAALHVAVAG